jgi:hypothetical protein
VLVEFRRSGPGDILSLPRRDLGGRDRPGLKRLTAFSIWLLLLIDLGLPRDWVLAITGFWITWLTRFQVFDLLRFVLYVAVFPVVVVTTPWWLGRERLDYIVEPVSLGLTRGLVISPPIHHWRGFRGTWVACLGISVVAFSRADPRLSAMGMILSGILVAWSGYRCLSLVAPPKLSRATIPVWTLVFYALHESSLATFKMFVEYIEPPWADKTRQRKSMRRVLNNVRRFSGLVRMLSARLYAGLRTRDRHISTAVVLAAQLERALATMFALALSAAFSIRLLVGTSQLDGWSALAAVSGLILPSGDQSSVSIPIGARLLVGLSSWVVLALFIAPLSHTFSDWQAYRAQQISRSLPIVRAMWRTSDELARLLQSRLKTPISTVPASSGQG